MFIILILFEAVNLNAEAVFSGNISTVDPRSGFNALRSPALMTFRAEDNIALGYIYSYLADSSPEIDAAAGGIEYDAKIESDETYNGAVILSSVYHAGKHAWGFGLTKGGEGQVVMKNSETTLEFTPSGIKYISDEDNDVFGLALLFSYSYRVSNRGSIGIQMETQASEISKEKTSKTYSYGSLVESKLVEMDQRRVTSGISAGYFFMGSSYEFGAGFKTGRFGFENREYSYDDKYNNFQNDAEVSNYFMHDDGMGLVTGINIKPFYGLSVAFEAAAGLPYTYEVKECDNDTITLDEYSTEVSMKYAFQFKGGVSYKWGRMVTFGAGGGYLKFKSESEGKDNPASGSTDFNIYQATAGADVKLTYDLSFMLGINYNIIKGTFEQESPAISMKADQANQTVDFITGISMTY